MNGATALDCAKTINSPKAMKMTTIGTSQNFFSWLRNCKNCEMTLLFFMMTSEHALEMRAIAIACRIGSPAGEFVAPPRQWILSSQPPHERYRHQQNGEQHR